MTSGPIDAYRMECDRASVKIVRLEAEIKRLRATNETLERQLMLADLVAR